jgi:hypothetical protein
MKKSFAFFASVLMILSLSMGLTACGKQTVEQRVSANIKDGVHALTSEERQLAETNAKQFYNRSFPNGTDVAGELTTAKGMFLDCRPSDSNANGMVTCHGIMPKMKGGFDDKSTRYCGYRPELVGCSDEDTVPK